MNTDNKKVFVGLSGGVDSSVSALLLKQAGFDVTGVFIKAWYPDFIVCNWREEMRDAMRICAKLDIPFLVCDLEKEYKQNVIDYMVKEYGLGRTPNPDVMCNKYIKFDGFLNFAISNGADYVATGHYAQNFYERDTFHLLRGNDREKDQSYFLWTLNQNRLSKILFPIGHLKKEEVRRLAEKNNLFTANKKDSQGLCFIGHVSIKDFLKRFFPVRRGDVLNESGEIVGEHDGSILYTMGERHGFRLKNNSQNRKILYVIKKDLAKNTITVSENRMETVSDGKTAKFNLEDENFINKIENYEGIQIMAEYRYHGKTVPVQISKESGKYKVSFTNLDEEISLGQSVVFYKGNECLGGGILS